MAAKVQQKNDIRKDACHFSEDLLFRLLDSLMATDYSCRSVVASGSMGERVLEPEPEPPLAQSV